MSEMCLISSPMIIILANLISVHLRLVNSLNRGLRDDPGSPSMSSEYSSSYSAAKCMDDNLNTYCYNKNGGDEKPYFMVEYATSVRVYKVRLIATKKYAKYAKNIQVFVTSDPSSSGTKFGSTYKGPATCGGEAIHFESHNAAIGKYVIVKQDTGIITFAEVHVQTDDPGSPSMSSEYSAGYSAAKCMDDNLNTYCYNKRGGDEKPYFMVEYAASVRVHQVRIIATKKYAKYAKNIQVFVTNDPSTSGTQVGSTFQGPATKGGQVIDFECQTGVIGKYVIVKQEKGIITFADVQIVSVELRPINGGWSEWGECSKTCGGGVKRRNCTNPAPKDAGLYCQSDSLEECNREICSSAATATTTPSVTTGCPSTGHTVFVSNAEANIITSPGYPQTNYSDNTFCDWTFQAPPGQKISFTLLELETEFGYDVLKLYDGAGGEEEKEPFLATMSGTKIHDALISSKEQMKVTFTTDGSKNGRGFKASVSAFNKEDLPRFDWLEDRNINVTFPNGKSEIVKLTLSPNAHRSCVFHGKTVNTSITISSSNTNSGCRSLTEYVEISITSNYLKGKFGLFSIKNGKLTKTDETVFVSKSLNRQVRSLSKRGSGFTLPKEIQIPVNFGFDRGLLTKLGKYGLGQNFIERRIEEVFDHGKYLLRGISSDISIDLVFKSAIVFINDTLHMNHQDLDKCRQFQVDEQTPLIILTDDDYANHVKGLSFRSGACRNDTQRYGVTMVAWNDHSAFMGDVVYHEMGHMLGGIHDGGKSEHHSGLHLGHSEFNSQNVNEWFISAGYRCYGKICTEPPSSPSNGSWTCDDPDFTSCQLICSPGYTPVISHIDCINGQWDTTNSHVCTSSSSKLYLLAGGWDTPRNVEVYHPTLGTPSCKSPPPRLPQDRKIHTSFYHNSTVYVCGSTCNSFSSGASSWETHSHPAYAGTGMSSVVLGDRVVFVGGAYYGVGTKYPTPTYATLPLTSSPTYTSVPNLNYRGHYPCVAKLSSSSFIISGGYNPPNLLSTVLKYDMEKESVTPLASLSQLLYIHGCISVKQEGKQWLIITGGRSGSDSSITAATQRLDIQANTWEDLGDLKEKRYAHSMINSESRGVLVLGGMAGDSSQKNSVERLVKQKWERIEPSVATGKSWFGGAVEVPADLFSCQLNLKPGLGCPATNINTVDREDETVIENIPTMEECSLECNKNLKCNFWTWFNGGQYSFNCILMSNYGSTLSDSTAVTADGKCYLGCPTPPARDNGAWTCNEANTICTLNCSPDYVSLHTEIKCSGGTWEEAESINCWEKKQPVEVNGCSGEYLYDEEYPGGEEVTVLDGETCHNVCEGREDCVTWTWTYNQQLQECRLQTSLGTNQAKIGSISGRKNACKPLCYLVIGEDDEARTNIRYCSDSSCQDILQMEASKFNNDDEILVCYQKGDMVCESINFEDVDLLCNAEPGITTLSLRQYMDEKLKFARNLGPHFKRWGKPYGRK